MSEIYPSCQIKMRVHEHGTVSRVISFSVLSYVISKEFSTSFAQFIPADSCRLQLFPVVFFAVQESRTFHISCVGLCL